MNDRENELKKAYKNVSKLHEDHLLSMGPFVVIVGPNLEEISAAYVCIDENIRYETSSCSSAVELCIQCVKCFEEKYSAVSNHVWETIEIVCCGLKKERPLNIVTNTVELIKRK